MTNMAEAVNFTVQAAFLVAHARALVLEYKWRNALDFLTSSLEGMTLDVAVQILKGEASLADARGLVKVAAQDPKDDALQRYLGTLAWQHAGTMAHGGGFYQPYARVGAFTGEDLAFAREEVARLNLQECSAREFRMLRARYHLEQRESDLVEFLADGTAVLLTRRPDPPLWVPVATSVAQSLQACAGVRQVPMVGDKPTGRLPEHDPRHWRFYEPLILQATLVGTHSDDILGDASLEFLEQLEPLQDALVQASAEHDAAQGTEGAPFDTIAKLEQAQDALYCATLGQRVREQAQSCGGFLPLTVKDFDGTESSLQVPAQPFLWWASRSLGALARGLAPWAPVCPSGLKMVGDNPMHTDWLVGAGLSPRMGYDMDHPVNKAAWQYALGLVRGAALDFARLAGKGRAVGRVAFPKPNEAVGRGSIAVVPHAGVEYELAMLSTCKDGAGAVLAATGGRLAHLAIVARETDARLAVYDASRIELVEGELLELDFDAGTLTRILQAEED